MTNEKGNLEILGSSDETGDWRLQTGDWRLAAGL
jgi:hypothetical protein